MAVVPAPGAVTLMTKEEMQNEIFEDYSMAGPGVL